MASPKILVSLLFLLVSLLQMATFVSAARILSPLDFSRFSIFIGVLNTIPYFSLLGVDQAILRDGGAINCKYPVKYLVVMILPAFMFAFLFVYFSLDKLKIGGEHDYVILCSLVFLIVTIIIAAINRKNKQYLKSVLVSSSWKIAAFFVVSIVVVFNINISLKSLILIYMVLIGVTVVGFLVQYEKDVDTKDRNQIFELFNLYKLGMPFFLNTIVVLALINIDRALMPIYSGMEEMASYMAISVVLIGLYAIIQQVIGFVLMPVLVNLKYSDSNIKEIIINNMRFSIACIVLVTVPILMFHADVSSYLFDNKYSLDNKTIYMIVGIGIMRVLYSIPSSLIGAYEGVKGLYIFSFTGVFAITLTIVMASILSVEFGLDAIVFSILVGWIVRVLTGSVICIKQKKLWRSYEY